MGFMKTLKILAVIPALFAAQRFPGKPLALIAGKPMVRWVYEAARRALPDVVVATDDKRIVDAVAAFGGKALLTSDQCRSGTDRVAEVAKKIRADLYLNVQGDEPLMTTRTVKAVLALHKKADIPMGTAATRLRLDQRDNPDVVKVLVDKVGDALYFSRAAIPFYRDGTSAVPSVYPPKGPVLKHLGIYSYRADFLKKFVRWPEAVLERAERLEQLRALENGARIRVAFTPDDSVGVDRPADAAAVEKRLKK
jgi:3-deoxy-manno-octulosonate cytidylyltransferase (CMP-KDO synthetase)